MVDSSDNDYSHLIDDEPKPMIYVMVMASSLKSFIRFRDSLIDKGCPVQKRTQGSFTIENKLHMYISEPDRQLRGRRNFETIYYADWFRHPKARLISDILEYHVKARNIRAESRIYE